MGVIMLIKLNLSLSTWQNQAQKLKKNIVVSLDDEYACVAHKNGEIINYPVQQCKDIAIGISVNVASNGHVTADISPYVNPMLKK
jgi:hypothetical protein